MLTLIIVFKVSEENLERFITHKETPREVVSLRWALTRQQLSDFSFSLRLKCVASVFGFTRMTEVLLIEPRMHPEAALAVFDDVSPASRLSGNNYYLHFCLSSQSRVYI